MGKETRKTLVWLVAEATDLTPKPCRAAVAAVVEGIAKALKRGDSVELRGLGTLRVAYRKKTRRMIPETDRMVGVPARLFAKFIPSKAVSQALASLPGRLKKAQVPNSREDKDV